MNRVHAFHQAHQEEINSDSETVRGLGPPSSTPAALGVLSGMAAGAVAGSIAGPAGFIAGAVIGSAVGAAAAIALDAQDAEDRLKDEALDRDIGVIGGDLGAASLDQPPSKRGTFSAASMGVSSEASVEPCDGPIPSAESE